jgi:hypothetical protein
VEGRNGKTDSESSLDDLKFDYDDLMSATSFSPYQNKVLTQLDQTAALLNMMG